MLRVTPPHTPTKKEIIRSDARKILISFRIIYLHGQEHSTHFFLLGLTFPALPIGLYWLDGRGSRPHL